MATAMKVEKFAGLTKVAPSNIESHATAQALKDAQYAYEMQILDLQNEIVHRQAKLRTEYLDRVNTILGEAGE